MRKTIAVLVIVLSASIAFAQGTGVGLGVIVGEPTGVSAKFWTGGNTAFDVAAA